MQLAIALTALGNVGVIMVFIFIAPLLTDVAGFPSGAVPVLLLVYGAGAVAALLTSALGLLAFAIIPGIPGMRARVLSSAEVAPTLAIAVNASGFQLAAAFAGWLGWVIGDGSGLRPLPRRRAAHPRRPGGRRRPAARRPARSWSG